MAKLTKAQKKRMILAIDSKAQKLFMAGVLTVNEYDRIFSMCGKALVKCGYSKTDMMR